MILTGGFLRRLLFGLSLERLDYLWTLFPGEETEARQQLRRITYSFVQGYNTALELGHSEVMVSTVYAIDDDLRGFAYEGIGMAMTLIDYFTPWNRHRLQNLLSRSGDSYSDLVHVGAGFAMAVLPGGVDVFLDQMNPMQRWLAIDGLGCYHGMFLWQRSVQQHSVPKYLTGYARRAFDQGLGRSIWFSLSADIAAISHAIDAFPTVRQPDLWSGIGLACTYAGGSDAAAIESLRTVAGSYTSNLAQGAAIAARMRYRAGNTADHNCLACSILCGMSAEAAAQLADRTFLTLPAKQQEPVNSSEPIYEVWRQRTQSQLMQLATTG